MIAIKTDDDFSELSPTAKVFRLQEALKKAGFEIKEDQLDGNVYKIDNIMHKRVLVVVPI